MLVLLGKVSSKISFRELVFKVLPNSKGRGIKVMLFKKKKKCFNKRNKAKTQSIMRTISKVSGFG